jgi:hypothetical protein
MAGKALLVMLLAQRTPSTKGVFFIYKPPNLLAKHCKVKGMKIHVCPSFFG